MSLARAFTKRSKRPDISTPVPTPVRSGTVKNLTGKEVTGKMISLPAFISTTNTLALNAPDVETIRALRSKSSSISSSSASSADDSDGSSMRSRSRDTQLTDASSVENSPASSPGRHSDEAYFGSKTHFSTRSPRRSASSVDIRSKASSPEASPQIPQRAPSHSKHAHQVLAKKRSLQQLSAHSSVHSNLSLSSAKKEMRASIEMFSPTTDTPPAHPFGKELEQLEEVAEEFGDAVHELGRSTDLKMMKRRNLARYCAADYISDLQPLFLSCFGPPIAPLVSFDSSGGWI